MNNFSAWFSGFFDGEGSIACLAVVDKNLRRKILLRCSITQRSDEIALLYKIQEELGGIVYPRTGGKTCAWALDGAYRLATVLVPLFDNFPLQTKKYNEWALVRPLIMERMIDIEPGKSQTSKGITDEFWKKVVTVSALLSEGRGTWNHLKRSLPTVTVKPRGRPVGIVEKKPRRKRVLR